MENVLQYLKWRGDLTFEERTWNEIDALICALLGYVEWDGIVGHTSVNLAKACQIYCQQHTHADMEQTYAYSPMIIDLIHLLPSVPRYQNIQLKRYVSIIDKEKDIQFAAVTIQLPQPALYIAFRGTDCSLLGWKEDFKMTFLDVIPSQEMALQYFKEIDQDLFVKKRILGIQYSSSSVPLYLGGHSKGGNLAMYAAICCDELKQYIHHVYSFDGPGFKESFYQSHDYQSIIQRIDNYVPVSSLIGRLLTHKEGYIIFHASDHGLQQHDAFSWHIDVDHFESASDFDEESHQAIQYIHEVLLSKTDQEKEDFISLIFTVLDNMEINKITDFNEISFKQTLQGIKELSVMNLGESKIFFEFLKFVYLQIKSVYLHTKPK